MKENKESTTYSRTAKDMYLTRNRSGEGLEVKDAFLCTEKTFLMTGAFGKQNAALGTIFSPVRNNSL
jgi:hypothetical protein